MPEQKYHVHTSTDLEQVLEFNQTIVTTRGDFLPGASLEDLQQFLEYLPTGTARKMELQNELDILYRSSTKKFEIRGWVTVYSVCLPTVEEKKAAKEEEGSYAEKEKKRVAKEDLAKLREIVKRNPELLKKVKV